MPSALISECESEEQSKFPTDKNLDNLKLKTQEMENTSKVILSTFIKGCEIPERKDFDAAQTVKVTSKIDFNLLKGSSSTKVNNSNYEADIITPKELFNNNNNNNHISALEPSITKLAESAAIPDMILHSKSAEIHDIESNIKNANEESLGVTPVMSSEIKNTEGSFFQNSLSVSVTAESSALTVKRSRGRPRKNLKSSESNCDQYLLSSKSRINNLGMNNNDMKISKSNKNILCFNKNTSAIRETRATKKRKLNKEKISNSSKVLPTEVESIAAEVSYVLNASQFPKINESKSLNCLTEIISTSENPELSDNHSEVVSEVNNVVSEIKKSRGRPKKNRIKTQTVKKLSVDSQLQNISNENEIDTNSHEVFRLKNVSDDRRALTGKEKLTSNGNEILNWSKHDVSKTLEIKRGRPKKHKPKLSDPKVAAASRSIPKKVSKLKMARNKSVKQIDEIHSEVSPGDKFSAFENNSLSRTGSAMDGSLKVKRPKKQTKRNHSKSSISDDKIAHCLKMKANAKKICKNKGPKQINKIFLEVKIQDETLNENKSNIYDNESAKIIMGELMPMKDIGVSLLALEEQSVQARKKCLVPTKKVKSKVTKKKKSHDSKCKEENNKNRFKSIVIDKKREKKLFLKEKKFSSFETFHNDEASECFMGSANLSDFQPMKEDSLLKTNKVSTESYDKSKKLSNHTVQNSQSADLLSAYKPKKCLWKILNEKDAHEYCPLMKLSPYFKSERTWSGKKTDWRFLKAFESEPLDDESCHNTFYTGGSVLCVAWCPIPGEGITNQYIALAVNISVDKYRTYECLDSGKCLIQLWNVGVLNRQRLKSNPIVELIIAQDHGIITGIRWCPSGCWEDPSNGCSNDVLPRLGMLAVSYSDSYVRIHSIPHPHLLSNGLAFPIFEISPSIILQPLFGNNCCATEKTMCVSLDWQKLDLCERVAAGYGNGMICVWHIGSTSIFLVSKENNATKISPYLVFNAHGTPVTSLSFAPIPGGRFLLSTSYDKTLKFWDLTDISLPFCAVRKGISLCADWADLYCGAFTSLDHGIIIKDACFLQECGLEKFNNRLLSSPNCPMTKISISKILNAIAMVDKSGSLSVSFYRNLLNDHKSCHYFHRPVYLTEIAPIQETVGKRFFSNLSKKFNNSSAGQDIVLLINGVNEKSITQENLNLKFVNETKEFHNQETRMTVLLPYSTSTDQTAEFKTSIECKSDLLPIDIADGTSDCETVCDISIDSESSTEYSDEIPFMQVNGEKPFTFLKDNVKFVISRDSTSSNHENELNIIDREMAESSMLVEKPELSDDSIISECSLNSNMEGSIYSLSEESNFSDKLYESGVDESKSKKVFLFSSFNSPSKMTSQSSDSEILISEKSQNLPSINKKESDVLKNKSATLNLVGDCDNQVEKLQKIPTFAKKDKSCSKPIANYSSKNSSTISRNLDELIKDPISSDLSVGTFSNVSCKSFSSSHFEIFQGNGLCTCDILTSNKCGKNSCDPASTRNETDVSDTHFATNCDKRKVNGVITHFENKLQNKCSEANFFSEVSEKNILDIEKSPDTNTDCNCNSNKSYRSVSFENSPIFDPKAVTSTLYSYADGGSQCGLVFRDMNTADFESIEDVYKEKNSVLFEKDPILSVKAVAWNPNNNCHSWLLSACHSGFARLSYISDMEHWKGPTKNKKTL